jgi:ketosteroid isomerase-like protein
MSQENVDIMRASNEAWNRGDMEAFAEFHDPDVVMRTAEQWPEPGPYIGREAFLRWQRQLRETWDTAIVELVTLVDAGDSVIVRQRLHGTGRGPEANLEATSIVTLRKGKVIMLEWFWDYAEALEAVGLSEADVRPDAR